MPQTAIVWIKGVSSMMATAYVAGHGVAGYDFSFVHVGDDPFVEKIEQRLGIKVQRVPFFASEGPDDKWLLTRSQVLGELAGAGRMPEFEVIGLRNDEQGEAYRYRRSVGPHGPKLLTPLVDASVSWNMVKKWCTAAGFDMENYKHG